MEEDYSRSGQSDPQIEDGWSERVSVQICIRLEKRFYIITANSYSLCLGYNSVTIGIRSHNSFASNRLTLTVLVATVPRVLLALLLETLRWFFQVLTSPEAQVCTRSECRSSWLWTVSPPHVSHLYNMHSILIHHLKQDHTYSSSPLMESSIIFKISKDWYILYWMRVPYLIYIFHVKGVHVSMFLTVGQMAASIGTKLGTWIHLNPESVLGKIKVKVRAL